MSAVGEQFSASDPGTGEVVWTGRAAGVAEVGSAIALRAQRSKTGELDRWPIESRMSNHSAEPCNRDAPI